MIPEGYRLLTKDDVGKTFGVDLESKIYIDSSVIPNIFTGASDYIPLVTFENTNLEIFISDPMDLELNVGIYAFSTFNGDAPTDGHRLYSDDGLSGVWTSSNVNLVNNLELSYTIKEVYFGGTFSGSNYEVAENTWLYVKDKVDPYNIVIKNKEGIKLLTKDKTIEFTDDVKVTIDESLLGGGESKKYNFTLYHESDDGGNSDVEYYSVDGGEFISTPSPYSSVELTGNYLVLYGLYGTGKSLISNVSVTGGTFVGTGLYASSGRYTVIFVTITEDNAEIYYDTYD